TPCGTNPPEGNPTQLTIQFLALAMGSVLGVSPSLDQQGSSDGTVKTAFSTTYYRDSLARRLQRAASRRSASDFSPHDRTTAGCDSEEVESRLSRRRPGH